MTLADKLTASRLALAPVFFAAYQWTRNANSTSQSGLLPDLADPLIKAQIEKAGARLAALLNATLR